LGERGIVGRVGEVVTRERQRKSTDTNNGRLEGGGAQKRKHRARRGGWETLVPKKGEMKRGDGGTTGGRIKNPPLSEVTRGEVWCGVTKKVGEGS